MRRRLVAIIFTLVLSLVASGALAAGPYLTCDPYDSVVPASTPTHFLLSFDNGADTISPVVSGWGPASATQVTAKHDLSTLSNGAHTVKGKACILVGEVIQDCSDYSEVFSFTKAVPALPTLSYVKEGGVYYVTSQVYLNSLPEGPPDSFSVQMDSGAAITVTPVASGTTGVMLKYDTTSVATGVHTIKVTAINAWGNSTQAASSFTRYVVVKPIKLRVVK